MKTHAERESDAALPPRSHPFPKAWAHVKADRAPHAWQALFGPGSLGCKTHHNGIDKIVAVVSEGLHRLGTRHVCLGHDQLDVSHFQTRFINLGKEERAVGQPHWGPGACQIKTLTWSIPKLKHRQHFPGRLKEYMITFSL